MTDDQITLRKKIIIASIKATQCDAIDWDERVLAEVASAIVAGLDALEIVLDCLSSE